MVEFCLLRLLVPAVFVAVVATVATLALLGDRPSDSPIGKLPLARDSDCREGLTFETEAAVWVVRPAGSLTGRVGDLGLGLTNPALAGDGWSGGGLLTDDALGVFVAVAFDLGVPVFSSCLEALSGVFAGSFGVEDSAGLFGALLTVGDLAGFAVGLLAEGTARGFGTVLGVPLVLGFVGSSLVPSLTLSFPRFVPFTGPASILGAGAVSEAPDFSAVLSPTTRLAGFCERAAEVSPFDSCATLGGAAAWGAASARGDSGIGWSWRLVLAVTLEDKASAKIFLFSGRENGVVWSDSPPLSLRVVETLESWLIPRCRPILPSFSMAMKSVRTLDSGRGDSLPIPERGGRGLLA